MKTPATFALLSCAWLFIGCKDDVVPPGDGGSDAVGGAGGDGGAGGSTPMADTTSTSTATSTSTSTGSTMLEPCSPLTNADDPNPTPGSCDENTVVTCGNDGFITSEICVSGSHCETYELQELRYNADPNDPQWVEARTVVWAGCLPDGAAECEVAFNGNYYWAVDPPHCEGVDRVQCRTKPAPFLFDNFPQLQYGNTVGYVDVEPCPSGDRCAGSTTFEELTCIDENTPACDGTEPSCADGGIEYCAGTWESEPGYKLVEDCSTAEVCYEGTGGPFCNTPGEVPCDPATSTDACAADGGSIVSCYQGFTYHQSCAVCWLDGQNVPCRCDDLSSMNTWSLSNGACTETISPGCVPQAAGECDPATDADTCVGNVAHRCLGHWDDIDCAAHGMICGVGAGVAGCRDANAPACDTNSTGTSCDGTEIVSCCRCGAVTMLFGPSLEAPCVTGYEARVDCADMGPYHCEPPQWPNPWAECQFGP